MAWLKRTYLRQESSLGRVYLTSGFHSEGLSLIPVWASRLCVAQCPAAVGRSDPPRTARQLHAACGLSVPARSIVTPCGLTGTYRRFGY
jgi:hypothetical protein